MSDDSLARLERQARRSAEDRIRAGDVDEVILDFEDLLAVVGILEERAASGDEWARSKLDIARARLRGVSAALGLED